MKNCFLQTFSILLILGSLQSALGANPSAAEINRDGVKSLQTGEFRIAIKYFKEALVLDPSYKAAKENLCKAYESLGLTQRKRYKLDDAIESYNQAIAIKPTARIYVLLGQAQQANRDPEGALKSYQRAHKLSPHNKQVLDALVGGWEAALMNNPISAENHIGLGQALQSRGDLQQARDEYKQAIRFSPNRKNPVAESLLERLSKIKGSSGLKQRKNN